MSDSLVKKVDAIIQALLYDLGVNAAVAHIITQVPFLNMPFFKAMTTWVVKQVANVLYKYLDQFVVFQIIDFQTEKQAVEYLDAVNKLLEAENKGDRVEIDKAVVQFKKTLSNLVRFDVIS